MVTDIITFTLSLTLNSHEAMLSIDTNEDYSEDVVYNIYIHTYILQYTNLIYPITYRHCHDKILDT